MSSEQVGVVLMDLGGPRSIDDVEEYIYELLSHESVLPLPSIPRHALARLIARARGPKVERKYAAIGGGSPIHREVAAQATALQRELGDAFLVERAFLFSPPRLEHAIAALSSAGVVRVLCLPTFLQRSWTTTDACVGAFDGEARRWGMARVEAMPEPDGEGIVGAIEQLSRPERADDDWVLFVAHGLPQSQIRRGDPYVDHVQRTVRALAKKIVGDNQRWSLAYQSKIGPMRWTEPAIGDELRRIAAEGHDSVCVIPISFACENLETLWDLDIEAAGLARDLGFRSYRRVPAPGLTRPFIGHLARLARRAAADRGWAEGDDARS